MKNERRLIRSDVSSLIQNGVQSDEAHKKRTASSCMSTEMKDFPPGEGRVGLSVLGYGILWDRIPVKLQLKVSFV